MSGRRRLDAELVRRGLASSRTAAQGLIDEGLVLVGGSIARKPAHLVLPGDAIELTAPPPRYVSRGGLKLEAALRAFAIDPTDRRALDAGASTGGFTDCLLQHGARSVTAVDVGHGQMHERVRSDARVEVVERFNIRELGPERFGTFDVVVADLSFISLRTVRDPLLSVLVPAGDLIVLVKPQFEAGRSEAARTRGVITDEVVRRRTVEEVRAAYEDAGADWLESIDSPIHGADGNVEVLAHLRRSGR